jgi:hypothetical protein
LRAHRGDEYELRELNHFAMSLEHLARERGRIPGPSLGEAVRELKERLNGDYNSDMIPWDRLERGVDGRGRPLILEWVVPEQFLKIRSAGYNGRDDHGARDDLPVVVDIRDWVKLYPPATRPN